MSSRKTITRGSGSSLLDSARLTTTRVARSVAQASQALEGLAPLVRVAAPGDRCLLCPAGRATDKVMLGPLEIGVCSRCSGRLYRGLTVGSGLLSLVRRLT
jgi:hypothetical protein